MLKLFSATNRCFHQGHKCDIYSSCASLALTVSSLPRARPQPLSEAKTASHRVFRHVGLGLRLLVPPKSIATFVRPIEDRLLFPQEFNGSPLQTTAVNSDNTCYPTLSQRRKCTETPGRLKTVTSWDCSFAFVPP